MHDVDLGSGRGRELGGGNLGGHATCTQSRSAAAGVSLDFRGDGRHLAQQPGGGVGRRIGRVKASGVADQHEDIRIDEISDKSGQRIVVAQLELVGCHHVIFINYRHHAALAETEKRGSRVKVAASFGEILPRDEHLSGGDAVEFKELVVEVHQAALSHGRQDLLDGYVFTIPAYVEPLTAGRHRPGGHDNGLKSGGAEGRHLLNEISQFGKTEDFSPAGQGAGAELEYGPMPEKRIRHSGSIIRSS